ncbi:MAG: hypothetical protein ACXV7J_06605 [Methylomonas sp.]
MSLVILVRELSIKFFVFACQSVKKIFNIIEFLMKKKLISHLCKKYPELNLNKCVELKDIGKGFYELIDVVLESLSEHNIDLSAVSPKMQENGLMFCGIEESEYSDGIETAANSLSYEVCENCSNYLFMTSGNEASFADCCKRHSKNYRSFGKTNLRINNRLSAWSRILMMIDQEVALYIETNNNPQIFNITESNGKLIAKYEKCDDFLQGLIDLYVRYANRIDEETGFVNANFWQK